jgi:SPP1 family predicted phage head-tail adaptor
MVRTWSAFARDVPASFDPARGREFFAASGAVVAESAMFGIRYTAGVVPEMRLKFANKVWDIVAVDDIGGREREMRLYCQTGLTEG